MRNIRTGNGFTLIELMIVVAIIGILAAIAIPNFLDFQFRAKSREAKNVINAIVALQNEYFKEHGVYFSQMEPVPNAEVGPELIVRGSSAYWVQPETEGVDISQFFPEQGVRCQYAVGTSEDGLAFAAVGRCNIDGRGDYAYYAHFRTDGNGNSVKDPLGGCEHEGVWGFTSHDSDRGSQKNMTGRCDTRYGDSIF
jgi:prepilin-type N-terminal cleavage/methylation domain-containing protein